MLLTRKISPKLQQTTNHGECGLLTTTIFFTDRKGGFEGASSSMAARSSSSFGILITVSAAMRTICPVVVCLRQSLETPLSFLHFPESNRCPSNPLPALSRFAPSDLLSMLLVSASMPLPFEPPSLPLLQDTIFVLWALLDPRKAVVSNFQNFGSLNEKKARVCDLLRFESESESTRNWKTAV